LLNSKVSENADALLGRYGRQLLEAFLEALRELPEVQAEFSGVGQPGSADRGYDAQVDLRAGGKAATLLIQVKKAVYPRDVRQALWPIREFAREWLDPAKGRRPVFFLVAQQISPGAKELLRNERVGLLRQRRQPVSSWRQHLRLRGQATLEEPVEVHPFRVFRPSCSSAARAPDAESRVVRSEGGRQPGPSITRSRELGLDPAASVIDILPTQDLTSVSQRLRVPARRDRIPQHQSAESRARSGREGLSQC